MLARGSWNDAEGGARGEERGAQGSSTPGTSPGARGALASGDLFTTHEVSKFDTLAGLAIKYNCSVVDIKRANNLHSDSAMFARGVLRIPLANIPAGHVSITQGGMPKASSCAAPTSSAMEKLRGYYGLQEEQEQQQGGRLPSGAGRQGFDHVPHGLGGVGRGAEGSEGRAGTVDPNGKQPASMDERLIRRKRDEDAPAPAQPAGGRGAVAGADAGARVGMGAGMGMVPPEDFVSRPSLFGGGGGGVLGGGARGAGAGGGLGMQMGDAKRGVGGFFDKLKSSASMSALGGGSSSDGLGMPRAKSGGGGLMSGGPRSKGGGGGGGGKKAD